MAKIKRVCLYCGKEFEVKAYEITRGKGKYCSPQCQYKGQIRKVKRVCEWCGKKFEVKLSRIKKGRGKYCSQKCAGKARGERSRSKRICEYCHKEFIALNSELRKGKARFCSRECVFNSISNKIKCICKECGKDFEIKPSGLKRSRGHFCSRTCAAKNNRRNRKGFPTHHTKPERIFEGICKKHNLPFKYTGDSSFWIGKNPSINPDFVECNGKKIVVEIFGDWWHSPILNKNISYVQTYEGRNKKLKEYGWKLIVFWETDLLREDVETFVLNKLDDCIRGEK